MKKKVLKKKYYQNKLVFTLSNKNKSLINKSLINNILQIDFLILNSSKNMCFNKHYISISKTLISLKIFIRLLNFLKKNNTCEEIFFWVSNLFNVELINQFFILYPIKKNFVVAEKYPYFIFSNIVSKIMLHFENEDINLKNIFNILTNRKYFLNQYISIYNTSNNINAYNIYNDTFCIKKIIFLLLLIFKILK
jgi:hypothetical protein